MPPLPLQCLQTALLLVLLLGEPTPPKPESGCLQSQALDARAHRIAIALNPAHVFLKPRSVIDERVAYRPARSIIEFAPLNRAPIGELALQPIGLLRAFVHIAAMHFVGPFPRA